MNAEDRIIKALENTVIKLYGITPKQSIQLQETRKEFEGDFTFVVYPLLPVSRKSPEQTAQDLGKYLN